MIENLIFPFDYILITLVLIVIIFSFLKGFINSVLSLLTWIGSILITIYTYEVFANMVTRQILKINFFQKYEYFSSLLSILLSIPIIFIITLFILKKIRKFLSSDLDKQILGIVFDKLFGIIYGILFSYIIMSTGIELVNKFKYDNISLWLINNSKIISEIKIINDKYIYMNEINN